MDRVIYETVSLMMYPMHHLSRCRSKLTTTDGSCRRFINLVAVFMLLRHLTMQTHKSSAVRLSPSLGLDFANEGLGIEGLIHVCCRQASG